jgi:hypothetical protein
MNVTNSNYAIYSYPYYSIIFGGGRDLNCNFEQCSSNLGHSYQLPSFLRNDYGSNEAQSFLSGSPIVQVVEIEVYWIDPCSESLCQNGGVCSIAGNNYKCDCINDFFGRNCQNKILNSTIFNNSTILSEEKSSDLVKLIGLNVTKNQLLYQASRDGFDPSVFHSKCNGVGKTLTVIKSKNSNIFGGFTSADWSGN